MGSPLHQEIHGILPFPPPPRETKLVFGPNADTQKMRWRVPENVAARRSSAMNPREEFAETLRFLRSKWRGFRARSSTVKTLASVSTSAAWMVTRQDTPQNR
jgi:hypothetical protein